MARKIFLFFILSLVFAMTGTGSSFAAGEAPRVTKEELKANLSSPSLLVLDVRAGRDWDSAEKKIAGAIREDPKAFDEWGQKYPKDKTLVLYCA